MLVNVKVSVTCFLYSKPVPGLNGTKAFSTVGIEAGQTLEMRDICFGEDNIECYILRNGRDKIGIDKATFQQWQKEDKVEVVKS